MTTDKLTDAEVRAEFDEWANEAGMSIARGTDDRYYSAFTGDAWGAYLEGRRAGVKHGRERERAMFAQVVERFDPDGRILAAIRREIPK